MLASPTLSLPAATMSMLLPVHALLLGLVIATVGGVGSLDGGPLLTVTVMDAVAVRPSFIAVALSVWVPFVTVFVSQGKVWLHEDVAHCTSTVPAFAPSIFKATVPGVPAVQPP